MDVRVGLWRRLSAEELMLLNCVGEDSWESLGLQGDPISPFWRKSALAFLWKEWCYSWNSSTLAASCEELTHWKRLWCWERLGAGGEGDDSGWDGWMASLTRWTWVWVNSKSWWCTGRPGVLRFMGLQRVGHDWVTELNWISDNNWRRQWHHTPVLLPGKSHGRRSLVGCSPWGHEGSDTTEWLHFHFSLLCIGEGKGNPLQCSCLENPRDGGAWWVAVYGVAQSGHDWSDLAAVIITLVKVAVAFVQCIVARCSKVNRSHLHFKGKKQIRLVPCPKHSLLMAKAVMNYQSELKLALVHNLWVFIIPQSIHLLSFGASWVDWEVEEITYTMK